MPTTGRRITVVLAREDIPAFIEWFMDLISASSDEETDNRMCVLHN